MARVIVELLKKMWPNEWSNFSVDVFSVVAKVIEWGEVWGSQQYLYLHLLLNFNISNAFKNINSISIRMAVEFKLD